jgi:four helix bundle protein
MLAKSLHKECVKLNLPYYMQDQLNRASLSAALNLAEGSAKPTVADKKRFYNIAFGSAREVQAVLDLADNNTLADKADHLCACICRLIQGTGS